MWDKSLRQGILLSIYEYLFKRDIEIVNEVNWDFISSALTETQAKSFDSVRASVYLSQFIREEKDLEKILLYYLKDWSKTFLLVRVVLYTFLLEIRDAVEVLKKTPDINFETECRKLIGKYIRITQQLIGGENTALVHAVISKIFEEYFIFPESTKSE